MTGRPDPPLSGLEILVTRPRGQAERLMSRLSEMGAHPIWLPALEIAPVMDQAALESVVASLADADWALFVSPTAVQYAWPLLQRGWGGIPAGVAAAAVGKGTARELAAHGVSDVLAPAGQADSEALLAMPAFAALAGRRVVIFHGEGGRELLADSLAGRGARVAHAICYRRRCPRPDLTEVATSLVAGTLRAVTVFSSESLDNLKVILDDVHWNRLLGLPLFVPHARIGEHAERLGVRHVIVTPSGEEGMLMAIKDYYSDGSA